ncbi:hypothetical protein Slin15195_G104550 [Septoria linicola]|uniref:Fungal N-terminal domain-containing protein n=1 Tax=Septoria linicola TaxID=215465 RepID=A0A9Q9EMU5_9PEZI|nr:hypothetical protein Slin14017_G067590 [Septoria linicola]USW57136.1 hypothetical protein Slin15195_G104550 [Septoria linicola]
MWTHTTIPAAAGAAATEYTRIMVDPGTALGIASLGIQVCEGLFQYYDKWRSYDKDIRDTCKHITELANLFAHLRDSLNKIDHDRKQFDHAREALRPCEESVLELQELLIKLKPYNAPTGPRECAWAQFRRATYPLKASTLAKMREIDEDIRDRLALALQALQIDIAAVSQAQLSTIERNIESVDASLKQVSFQTSAAADGVNALLKTHEQQKLDEISRWLSKDQLDPWSDYKAARDKHNPGTGDWLLASQSYKAWKTGQT